jgi:hypothetical protein
MKKSILTIAVLLFAFSSFSQGGFYAGYENGGLFDKFQYVNDKGNTLWQTSIGGILGGYAGYKIEGYSVETGFYGLYPAVPFVDYNYNTGEVSKSNGMGSGDAYFMVPLRVGKEFLFAKGKLFVKPQVSFNTIYSPDYTKGKSSMGWGENLELPGSLSHNTTGDSTIAKGYYTSFWNFALETSIAAGYRIKKRIDIYIKWSYSAYFRPLYYENITHYSGTGQTVYATRVNVNATLFQIGLNFYLKKQQ